VYLIRGDSYVAGAKLLVRLGQEQAPAPTMIADHSVMIGNQVGYAAGEIGILDSRDLISEFVDQFDLSEHETAPATLYQWVKYELRHAWRATRETFNDVLIWAGLKVRLTPREEAIEAVSRALSVDSPPNGNIFTARLIWPDRGVPGLMLSKLLDLYFAHRAALYQGSTAENFFGKRREETAGRLATAETALAEFERRNVISNPDEQRSGLLRRLAEANTGVDSARLEVQLVETSLKQLEAAQAAGDAELATFAVAQHGNALEQTLAGDIATAAARWLAAQTTLSPQDPNVRRQRAEVAALSNMLVQQLRASEAQRREQLKLREEQRDAIAAELAALQAAVTHWQDLKRDVASGLRAYEFNDGKLNEAIGIAALEQARIGNVVVLQHAAEQATPIGIRRARCCCSPPAAACCWRSPG
jgi:uncharacterized protein involved in exopolysaccharide biosynthesis